MKLYIDTNIYLEYFRENSAERLATLEKLVKLIEEGKVSLILPTQTKDEYYRNRRSVAEVTREALVKQSKITSLIPAIYDKKTKELKDIEKHTKTLSDSYKKLITKHDKDVEAEKTDADLLIKKLFTVAVPIAETKEVIDLAYQRYMKGNPPKKNDNSYGDAIIWESLLVNTTDDSLVIITKDGDYTEPCKGAKVLKHFLHSEWKSKAKKGKKITLYKSLGEFVNTLSPKQDQIKKEIIDQEKQEGILANVFRSYISGGGNNLQALNLYPAGNITPLDLFRSTPSPVPTSFYAGGGGGSISLYPRVSHCPYCGSSEIQTQIVANGFLCQTCNSSFYI